MRIHPFAACAVLVLAAACAGDDADEAATTTTTTTTITTDADETTTTAAPPTDEEEAPAGAEVEVLDAGAEPRQELRLTVEQGREQGYVIHQEQEQTIEIGGQTQSTATATEQDVTYTITDVADGRIVAETTYGGGRILDDPPVDASTRDVLEQVFAAFEGATGSSTFDERGSLIDVEIPDLEIDQPQLQAVLDTLLDTFETQAAQLAMPFPQEPVGVGARWRVSTSFDVGGLPFDVTTEVTLTAIGEGTADATSTQTMSIRPGPAEVQGQPLEVISGNVSGGGSVRWDLRMPLAVIDQEVSGEVVLRTGGTELRQVLRQRYQVTPV